MVTTTCPNCGSIEHTLSSIGARCYYCFNGIMKLVSLKE